MCDQSEISGSQLHAQIPLPLLVPLLLLLLSLSGCLISTLLASLHRWLAPHEFAFANGFCGKIEKVVSGVQLDQQQGEEEEAEREKQKQGGGVRWDVPILRFGIGTEEEDGGLDELLRGNGTGQASTAASLLALHRKQSISTIEEEEDAAEMNNNNGQEMNNNQEMNHSQEMNNSQG